MLEKLCGPVILYIGFSLVHILLDLIQKQPTQALVKFLVMFVFICRKWEGKIFNKVSKY